MITSLTTRNAPCVALVAGLALILSAAQSRAINLIFQEDFESIPLGSSPTYSFPGPVWSDDPPLGWQVINNLPFPPQGVPEWEGWAFAREDFWKTVGSNGREQFNRAQGTIAVADPDLWNDFNNPANTAGFYNTLLRTPPIPLDTLPDLDDTLRLAFDSSWRGGCCDDGQFFDPGGNNQTAIINVRIDGGNPIEVLRWESAPFYELIDGEPPRPTDQPFNAQGTANMPNEYFRPDVLDERFYLDLSGFLPTSGPAFSEIAAASTGGGSIEIEFGVENAGDDGWWGLDNIQFASMSTIPGDMNIDSIVDMTDVDAFALGLRSEDGYRDTYFGSFPVERGSPDATFNFDDIPWFVSVVESAGSPGAAMALARALAPIPEPTTTVLLFSAAALLVPRRTTVPRRATVSRQTK